MFPQSGGLTNLVELVEYFLISQHVGRDGHIHHWVGGPERHGENVHCQVDLVTFLGVLLPPTTAATEVTHVLLESHIDVPGQLHVLEHALQLAGEARTEERKFIKISGCCDCTVRSYPHSAFSLDSMLFSLSTLADFPTNNLLARSFL